ncbi:hypothetical protein LQW54_003628 [Pestalotiopsis sp. IQ-011]
MYPGRNNRQINAPWRGRGRMITTNEQARSYFNNSNFGGGAPLHPFPPPVGLSSAGDDSDSSSDSEDGGAPLRSPTIASKSTENQKMRSTAIEGNIASTTSSMDFAIRSTDVPKDQTNSNMSTATTPQTNKGIGTNELLAMIRRTKPEFFRDSAKTSAGGSLVRSQTFTDGFHDDAPLGGSHILPQPIQPNLGTGQQSQSGNTLRTSRTDPSMGDSSLTSPNVSEHSAYRVGNGNVGVGNQQSFDNSGRALNDMATTTPVNIQAQIEELQRMQKVLQENLERNHMALQSAAPQQVLSNHHQGHRATQSSVSVRPGAGALITIPEMDRDTTPRPGPNQSNQMTVAPQANFERSIQQELGPRSQLLNELLSYDNQSLTTMMLDSRMFPFIENASKQANRRKETGVLKIANCPFNVSRNEIIAIFGRAMRLLNDNEEPVHIILEKVTAKTLDAYAEFETPSDAMQALERIRENIAHNRPPRIGPRAVKVEFSNQAALMNDLFPVAHGVTWSFPEPTIRTDSKYPIDNFKCFTSEEENAQLSRHFECHGRTPFSRDCPERFIESMISTLKKLPWQMTKFITVHQQHYIFESCCNLMATLIDEINSHQYKYAPRRPGFERLTEQVLHRFIDAIMLCPGFTVVQKDNIAAMVNMNDQEMRRYNMPRFANSFTHLYALSPKQGVPLDLLEFYIHVIRIESTRALQNEQLDVKMQLTDLAKSTDSYFGYFWREVNYPLGPAFDQMTLHQAAKREWVAMDQILRRFVENAMQSGNSVSSGINAFHGYSSQMQIGGANVAGLLMN